MKSEKHSLDYPLILIPILAGTIFLGMGCNLFSAEYWVHRLDPPEEIQDGAALIDQAPLEGQKEAPTDGPMAYAQQFGVRCIDAPGIAPCPMEACVVSADQFSAKYEITSELYGKANPNNFSCCAEFQFLPAGKDELMTFEHWVTEYDDSWSTHFYVQNQNDQPVSCSNYYAQKDGVVTRWPGITEMVVLYANPHCEWIQQNEPGIKKYIHSITGPCVPQ